MRRGAHTSRRTRQGAGQDWQSISVDLQCHARLGGDFTGVSQQPKTADIRHRARRHRQRPQRICRRPIGNSHRVDGGAYRLARL
jgi:hypothetical protein